MRLGEPCDACRSCVGCGITWCRDNETSPGEADDLCPRCWETEDDGGDAA